MRSSATQTPKSVCIETYNMCNGSCIFCPFSSVKNSNDYLRRMDSEVVRRLIDELKYIPIERLSLFNNNEPLLDERIISFIRYAKNNLPHVRLTLSSNGIILNRHLIEEVIGAGVDRFFISIPSLDKHGYQVLMNHELGNLINVIFSIKTDMYEKIRIAVPINSFFKEKEYFNSFAAKGIKYVIWDMEANSMWDNYSDLLSICDLRTDLGCDRPLDQMIIAANGDVVTCCRDWFHENVLGNVTNESLIDIWNGKKMRDLQKKISESRFDLVKCCKTCSRVRNKLVENHDNKGIKKL